MCVKPADLTTHSPPKTSARSRTATRPARAFSHSLPAHFRSPAPRRCTPADLTTHSPSKTFARPRTTTRPSRALPPPHAAPTHTRRLRHAFLAEDLRSPPLFRFGHKKNGTAQWMCDAFPADLTTHSPPKTFAHPRTATRPPRALPLPHAAPTHTRRLRDARPPTSRHIPLRRPSPADLTTHSSSKISSPPPLFRFGHKKKRHRTVDVRCRMSRSTVVAVGHWGW